MYYFYRKSNRGHGICPLYRGCPPFRESIIRGFTVVVVCMVSVLYLIHLFSVCISEIVICAFRFGVYSIYSNYNYCF